MFDMASTLLEAKKDLKRSEELAREVLTEEFGGKNGITTLNLLGSILFQRR